MDHFPKVCTQSFFGFNDEKEDNYIASFKKVTEEVEKVLASHPGKFLAGGDKWTVADVCFQYMYSALFHKTGLPSRVQRAKDET